MSREYVWKSILGEWKDDATLMQIGCKFDADVSYDNNGR